jgi:hypothetical protein
MPASSSSSDDWDDVGFDVVETPPVVHSITYNSSGSRYAIAHSRGADVYTLFGAPDDAQPSSGDAKPDGLPPLVPRRILRLNRRHLCTSDAQLPTNSSEFFDVDEDAGNGPPALNNAGTTASGSAPTGSAELAAGVGLVALLYDTNVLAVVGGGAYPCQPPDRILLFNGEYEQQRIKLFGPVARVVLQNRRVISLSQTFVSIHDFSGTKLFEEPAIGWAAVAPLGGATVARMSTAALASVIDKAAGVPSGAAGRTSAIVGGISNDELQNASVASTDPHHHHRQGSSGGGSGGGASPAVSQVQLRRMPMDATNVETNPIVAFPDQVSGSVAFCDWLNPGRITHRIAAHRGELDAIALSANGEALITASDTNTVLRVWNVASGAKLREVRLASAPRTTYLRAVGLASRSGERTSPKPSEFQPDLAFALDSAGSLKFFFVGSATSTDAPAADENAAAIPAAQQPRNKGSLLSSFQFVSSYFASEWHCAQLALPFLPLPDIFSSPVGGASPDPSSGKMGGQSPSGGLTAAVPSSRSIIPVDGVAWFDLPAALARYAASSDAARRHAEDAVTVTCLAGCGVVVRVTFNTKAGHASITSRAPFSL